ncbi:unnamed protein product [Candida verbasci]|uniref:Uncharacterized protein n=1 Tax=Candida verbasci TaxID=1227364 RepID=A0A9W4TYZ3_9ASCO|nr:unnamed protein product [Candida verbasci]
MAPAKRHWVKLKVPKSFLSKLPNFPTPILKSRLKKIAQEDRKSGIQSVSNSNKSSPAPDGGNTQQQQQSTMSQYKINVGLKDMSTAGLTMNSIAQGTYALDKSGKPTRKWVKKPREFKTFTGFKVKYTVYQTKDKLTKKENKDEKKVKKEDKSKKETTVTQTQIKVEAQ